MSTPIKLPRPFDYWTTYPGHSGIDYPVADDVMVKASGPGTVVQSGYWNPRGGWGVIVRYDNGIEWGYCHSDFHDWRIKLHAKVKLGTPLMEVGGTGLNSTGPHLHQDIRVKGVIIPPPAYWNYVLKTEDGYVGAPNFSGTTPPKPLVNKESNMLKFRWKTDKDEYLIIGDADSAYRVTEAEASAINRCDPSMTNFRQVSPEYAATALKVIRRNRAQNYGSIADAVTKQIDELIAAAES